MSDIQYYLIYPHAPLPANVVEAIGLDPSGVSADERFPYTWVNLSPGERARVWLRFRPASALRGKPEEYDEPKLDYGDVLTDGQCELLRDVEAEQAAGDSDWRRGAVYVYVLDDDLHGDGQTVPAGVYLRAVEGNTVHAWPVLSGDVDAYMEAFEEQYLEETLQ